MSHTELTNHVVVQEGEYSIVYNDATGFVEKQGVTINRIAI